MKTGIRLIAAASLTFLSALAGAQNAVTPKEVVIEPATLTCIGLEWRVDGDDNGNAACAVKYRVKGAAEWKDAQPLLRLENKVHAQYKVPFGNMLAGSIFFLEPKTEYEVQLSLSDPDGGAETKVVTVTTRGEPAPAADARRKFIGPDELEAAVAAAQPGDMLVLKPGEYKAITVTKDGTPEKPIVLRGSDVEKVVFTGTINVSGREYVHIENVTVNGKGLRVSIQADAGEGIAVIGCVSSMGNGTSVRGMGNCRNYYISDNRFDGAADWEGKRVDGTGGDCVQLSGSGNVICYNLFKNNWDNISLFTGAAHQRPGPDWFDCSSVDVYGNDFYCANDDGVEADYQNHNIRIFKNRLTNVGSGISCQPVYGGPAYTLYNEICNTRIKPFKWHSEPSGLYAYHNTSISALQAWETAPFVNGTAKNNILFANPDYKGGNSCLVSFRAQKVVLDYNGYNKASNGTVFLINRKTYDSLDALGKDGFEQHGCILDIGIFERAQYPIPSSWDGPYGKPFAIGAMDLRLKADAGAIDKGEPLANINDGFTGKAPDLGCYEFGKPLPQYGPRKEVLERLKVEVPK